MPLLLPPLLLLLRLLGSARANDDGLLHAFSLACAAPDAQRVAGAGVDFVARITARGGTAQLPLQLPPVAQLGLCGAFSGQARELCGIRGLAESVAPRGPAYPHQWDVKFHLSGFLAPAVHTYKLWLHGRGANNFPVVLSACTGQFETAFFPGWDNYVQRYYNATETLRALDEDVPKAIARVGRPGHARASFERMHDLLGPQMEPGLGFSRARTLVATFAGKNSIRQIDALARRFTNASNPRFSFVLFAYDRTHWAQFDWVERATVIRLTGTMKWRFVRTFLSPSLVGVYEHLVVIDEDCNIDGLDVGEFLDDMRAAGVQIGQPANGPGSYGSHDVVRQQEGRNVVWTNFVECGPFVAFDARVWPCVFDTILQPDITCGYGLDLVWQACGPTAVLHHHTMVHENRKPASNRPNFVMRCAAEGLVLFERLAHRGITPVDPGEVPEPEAARGLAIAKPEVPSSTQGKGKCGSHNDDGGMSGDDGGADGLLRQMTDLGSN